MFASLFKANKWTWLFGWSFHLALVLLFFRHLVYFWPGEVPLILYKTEPFKYAAYPLIFGLLGLLGRRLFVDRVRYISAPSDFLMLLVFIFIASTGMIMTFANNHPNILMVKNFASGLITFNWSELPGEIIFLSIFFLFFVSLLFFLYLNYCMLQVYFFHLPLIRWIMHVRKGISLIGLLKKKII